MKTRDIVIGLVVLAILITAVLLVKRSLNKQAVVNTPSQQVSIQQKIKNTFPGLTIPEDSVKSNLVDVSGGNSFGVATSSEVLANLPDLAEGKVYKVWLEDSKGKSIFLGNLRAAKGGYLIEYNSAKYPDYTKIVITLDNKNILEGSF